MAEVLRRLGCEVAQRRATRVVIDVPERLGTEADYDLVRRLRASICVLGPAAGPLRARPGGAPRRRRDRLARPGHARGRPGPDGRRDLRRARLRHRHRARGLHGATDLARLPERRRHREPADGGGAGQGHHRDRQRGPRAGDRRHLPRCSPRWAPRSTAPAPRRSPSRASTALHPVEHRTVGDRIVAGTWAFGAAMTRGDVTVHGIDPAFLEIALDKIGHGRRPGRAPRPTPSGSAWTDRPTRRRHRHAAVPRLRHRPAADGDRPGRGQRGLLADHREHLRRPVHVRATRWSASAPTSAPTATTPWCAAASASPAPRSRATDIRAGAGLVIAGLCADGVTEIAPRAPHRPRLPGLRRRPARPGRRGGTRRRPPRPVRLLEALFPLVSRHSACDTRCPAAKRWGSELSRGDRREKQGAGAG